jgi:pimeloyl-ACP methyl ester carboxylesterase
VVPGEAGEPAHANEMLAVVEGTVRLADGRRLGFAEYGDSAGRPVLWFHGTPGGRHQVPPAARLAAARQGVRLIALERPGVGDSTPHLYHRVLGWTDDVAQAVARLGIGRFGLIGLSGGGPYVLACARRFPERIVAGAILGGVVPARGLDAAPGGAVPLLARFELLLEALREPLGLALWGIGRMVRPLAWSVAPAVIRLVLAERDSEVVMRPGMYEMFVDDLLRASDQRFQGPVYDVILFGRHWGFSPRDVRVPIRLWHGDTDPLVPLAHALHLAAILPDAELAVRAGESHLGSLAAAEEVLSTILTLWSEPRGRVATA